MGNAKVNTSKIDVQLLKLLSRTNIEGISSGEISEVSLIELGLIKKFLKLLAYASAD